MAHLTSGTFYYERRVKTGDWEHKFSHATINYALDEGDDADELLARARTVVVRNVHQAIGLKAVSAPVVGNSALPGDSSNRDPGHALPIVEHEVHPVVADVTGVVSNPDPVADPSVVVPDELNRGFIVPESFTKPDEDLLPRTTIKDALDTEILRRAIVAEETPTLKEALANFIPMAPNLKAAKRAAKKRVTGTGAVEDPIVVVETEDFTAEAPAATDIDLAQALSRVNAKLKDRPRIQTLIGEFVQSGQSYSMIPAVRRTEFISKLEALV